MHPDVRAAFFLVRLPEGREALFFIKSACLCLRVQYDAPAAQLPHRLFGGGKQARADMLAAPFLHHGDAPDGIARRHGEYAAGADRLIAVECHKVSGNAVGLVEFAAKALFFDEHRGADRRSLLRQGIVKPYLHAQTLPRPLRTGRAAFIFSSEIYSF